MVKVRIFLIGITGSLLVSVPLTAHEGHDHGAAAPQESVQKGPILLSEEAKKNLEIQTAEASVQAIEKTINASGTVQAIAGARENVSSRISGRVVEVNASLGQFKKKGETLFILEARQLSETAIRISVPAPRSGKVVRINVIKGDGVEIGTSLLELADYSEVYAVAEVYESQIGKITKGMAARVYSPSLKNNDLKSKVDVIGTEVNPQSRTIQVWQKLKLHATTFYTKTIRFNMLR